MDSNLQRTSDCPDPQGAEGAALAQALRQVVPQGGANAPHFEAASRALRNFGPPPSASGERGAILVERVEVAGLVACQSAWADLCTSRAKN